MGRGGEGRGKQEMGEGRREGGGEQEDWEGEEGGAWKAVFGFCF